MEFQRATLLDCGKAEGTVVVIDVLRAFSTAAYAFAAGVRQIQLVSTVEAARLRRQMPGALVMGEVEGLPVPGFDFSNSPPQFNGLDLGGRLLIQRTIWHPGCSAQPAGGALAGNQPSTLQPLPRHPALSPSRVTL
jgi:2-phosphosulfolactate phosphatase